MIAEILEPFNSETLQYKINYQMKKVADGVAVELYNSSSEPLKRLFKNMSLVAGMNDRVRLPYIEFVLSSPAGERLSPDKFMQVAKEYMIEMGYGESCFSIIENTDKDNRHVHILATRIDFFGERISDSFSNSKSCAVMRNLEQKYGLQPLEIGRERKRISLGESLQRQYYFDTALRKGLRSYSAKTPLLVKLRESENFCSLPERHAPLSNLEWKVLLGDQLYEDVLDLLSEGGFLSTLYKDELLQVMDQAFQTAKTVQEFRKQLSEHGCYMRLVSSRGVSHYVYGIRELGFYVKDSALPKKYRWGQMEFDNRRMQPDEQKHYLYNVVFQALHSTSSYQDFKEKLSSTYHVYVVEHTNNKGIYGLSFSLKDVDNAVSFNGSDLSRRLTYSNIQGYFSKETALPDNPVYFVTRYYPSSPEMEKDILYMVSGMGNVLDDYDGRKKKVNDDNFSSGKKKKKRSSGISLH